MPPFQYDDYRSPLTGTLIDLLRERGAIDASAAERIAGVRANASIQRGATTAAAIRDVAALPGQVMAAREQRQDKERNRQVLIATEVGSLAQRANGNPELFKAGVAELARMGVVPKEMHAHILQQVDAGGPEALSRYALFGQQAKEAAKTRAVETVDAKGNPITKMVPETDTGEYPKVPGKVEPPKLERVETVDDKGNPVTRFVVPSADASYAKQAAEGKRYPVTVDDGRGNPVQRLVTEEELQKGVPAYRAPKDASSEPLVAIMGPDGEPVLVPRSDAVGKRPANTREQGKQVTSGDTRRISDFNSSLLAADAIATGVTDPGTLSKIQSVVPNWVNEFTGGWSDDAKSQNAVIALVRQIIGKALEGGVLRKEDEIKYKDILPQLGETKALVKSKLKILKERIEDNRDTFLDSLEDSNYDVSKHRDRLRSDPGGIR